MKLAHAVPIMLLALATACTSATAPSGSLVGQWIATSIVIVNPANSAQRIDLMALGARDTLTLTATTYAFSQNGESRFESGTWTQSGTNLLWTLGMTTFTQSVPFALTNGNNTLTLSAPTDPGTFYQFVDWNNDNIDDPATQVIVFARN